jgi:hypothetical protein
MMLNNNVPLGAKKPEGLKRENTGHRKLRLDAKSATETFAAQGAVSDGQFSQFVNFTSSRFQTESTATGAVQKDDDSYLF